MSPIPPSVNLRLIARQAMLNRGFRVDFPPEVIRETSLAAEPPWGTLPLRDLSSWLWSSIDNDDTRDLDQLEYVEVEKDGTRLFIGIANVNAFVSMGSATDEAAWHNTTSIYTGVKTYGMLPEKLSTGLSSLLEGQRRLAVVVDILISASGEVLQSTVYPAIVKNHAQLTYTAVASWLDGGTGTTGVLDKIRADTALQQQLLMQDRLAQTLRQRRHLGGALSLQTMEWRPSISEEGTISLASHEPNRATQLIEDFMIAANQSSALFLERQEYPSLRRVVRTPKRWNRIVELAATRASELPTLPDAKRLEEFLIEQQRKDPKHFPDLSLSIIKLLGRGEYIAEVPGEKSPEHFSLAVQNYSHSTAPNRRYPDLIAQRLLLAACAAAKCPYSLTELSALAMHCTQKDDDAHKVERSVHKSIAAVAMSARIGEIFQGIITGASDGGTWVRTLSPAVEGKIQGQSRGVDVGKSVQVRLVSTDPVQGHIDFELI
jgi:VacB/RNase II family 3'-5' exoribonuclease